MTFSEIEQIFQHWNWSTPGCAIGIEMQGQPPYEAAFGSSDLSHGILNMPNSVFEAGSVSKQFTAAALLTLVESKRVSLTDDVRRYMPELPDYGLPITLDDLLRHTSGLREWDDIGALGGWPRGSRVYAMPDIVEIAVRQNGLNFLPGAAWFYNNTGYILAAIVLERASGETFEEYTRQHLFAPLDMSDTGWRTDFRSVVARKAIAYVATESGYREDMPIDDVVGAGGLLTTVGDLLTWNRALDEGRLGPFVTKKLTEQTILPTGHVAYARGLVLNTYHGRAQVFHSGATAGYRAWLGRFPNDGLSIALLCNAADADSDALALAVADRCLPAWHERAGPKSHFAVDAIMVGTYVEPNSGRPLRIVADSAGLLSDDGRRISALASDRFRFGEGELVRTTSDELQELNGYGITTYARSTCNTPSVAEMQPMVGRYHCDDTNADYEFTLVGEQPILTILGGPHSHFLLKPAYPDAFTFEEFVVRVLRSKDGAIEGLSFSSPRAWNLQAQLLRSPK